MLVEGLLCSHMHFPAHDPQWLRQLIWYLVHKWIEQIATNRVNSVTGSTTEHEALARQRTSNSESSKTIQARKKEPRGKFPERFHLEARWNLLTEVSTLSRACIRQSGTGDETDKHTQETSTTLSVNWLWLNTSCHQGNRGNERKALFLCKEKNFCQKETRK